jgi:hypothetical protein
VIDLGRAPLDRAGFAFGFELGLATTGTLDRDGSLGFAARTSFGLFPIHEVGLLVGLGAGATGDVVEWRPYVELQAHPLTLGLLSVGMYAQGGYATGTEAVPDAENRSVSGWYYGGGAIAQLEITTRLAVTFRGGVSVLTDPGESMVAPEGLIGLAIY